MLGHSWTTSLSMAEWGLSKWKLLHMGLYMRWVANAIMIVIDALAPNWCYAISNQHIYFTMPLMLHEWFHVTCISATTINTLWPSDVICWHRSASTFPPVMAPNNGGSLQWKYLWNQLNYICIWQVSSQWSVELWIWYLMYTSIMRILKGIES